MIAKTPDEVNDYVRPLLKDGIDFNCHPITKFKPKTKSEPKYYRLEFHGNNNGKNFNFGRRCNVLEVMSVIDGYIEEVNRVSSY